METRLFKFNDNINPDILKEAIYANIVKAKAVANHVLFACDRDQIDQECLHGAIWAIEDYLEELHLFCEKLNEIIN